MKKLTLLLRVFLVLFFVAFTAVQSMAQFGVVGDMIKSGKDDANIMLTEYLTPIGKAWGADLGGGWYNTANTHGMLGFDLTFSTSFAKTPDTDLLFDMAELNLQSFVPSDPNKSEFPTVTNGDVSNTFNIESGYTNPNTGEPIYLLQDTKIRGFDVPVGMPLPTLNLGIGIIKNTEVVARYIPNTKLGDFGELGLWGVGVKHDILQWLPIVDKVPFLKTSVFVGYTQLNSSFDIKYQPEVDHQNNYVNPENQQLKLNTSALHGAIIVGAKLPVVHPYLSFGMTTSNFGFDLAGEYALPAAQTDNNDIPTGDTELRPNDSDYVLQDPISVDISNGLKPSVAAGLRIKMTVLTIHAQYTIQEYTMITGGIGISFR